MSAKKIKNGPINTTFYDLDILNWEEDGSYVWILMFPCLIVAELSMEKGIPISLTLCIVYVFFLLFF